MMRKKIFGIGVVISMILIAFTPAINGMNAQINTEKINDFCKETRLSSADIYDLELTVKKLDFDRYEDAGNEDYINAVYILTYQIKNNGIGSFVGRITTEALLKGTTKLLGVWNEEGGKSIWIKGRGGTVKYTHEIILRASDIDNYDKERNFSAKDIVVKTVTEDEAGTPDPNPGNNFAIRFCRFWSDNKDYIPSKTHMELSLPGDAWMINEWKEFRIAGKTIRLPVFNKLYFDMALPSLWGSNRMGWLWDLSYNFTNATIAFLKFVAKFTAVLADIVLIVGEVALLTEEIIAFFTPIIDEALYPGPTEIAAFLGTLASLALTLVKLMKDIQDLPIHPDDPERKELAAASQEFVSFLASQPWLRDITIEGEVHKVKDNEQLTIKCRNETFHKNEEGDPTYFGPFNINSKWNLDPFIFRNCQVVVTGNKHTSSKPLKTPRLLSYAAPDGYLYCTFSFPEGGSRVLANLNFLDKIINYFPQLTQLFAVRGGNNSPSFV